MGCDQAALVRHSTFLESNWPYASGLLAENVIGTLLRELRTDTGTVEGMDGRFAESEMKERVDEERGSRACLARPNPQVQIGTGILNKQQHCPCSDDHTLTWQPYKVGLHSLL